jgi:hypothetical protein
VSTAQNVNAIRTRRLEVALNAVDAGALPPLPAQHTCLAELRFDP